MANSLLALAAAAAGGVEVVEHAALLPTAHRPTEIEAPATDEAAVTLDVAYTGDMMANALGGIRRGSRYLDNLDVILVADLQKLAGWRGATLQLYGLYNNGASISELAGDAQAVSNLEAGTRALRLYEAWIDQQLGSNLSLRVGLYDLNSEFDALEAASLFVGSAHGIGTDFAQSGENGPSIFPSTSLAARLQVRPAEGWVVRGAVLDGVPGNPDHPGRTAIRLRGEEGALLVGEIEAPIANGRLLLGHWRYTSSFETFDGMRASGNAGVYLRGEAPLVDQPSGKIDGFFRLGTAAGRFNVFDRFVSGGLTFTGWLPGRGEDQFGLAVAAAFVGSHDRAAGADASEIAFEATYRARVAPWLAIQPHAQYVRNPSADPSIDDAVVIGVRTEISFGVAGY